MLTETRPSNWRMLQSEVAAILAECGFVVAVEKTIISVRGKSEIDVYATESIKGRPHIVLCECKRWSSRVPKAIVQAFRTVVDDIGANTGYIISAKGFQKGAFETAKATNVVLATWESFQEIFEQTWLDNYFSRTLTDELDDVMTFLEPFVPDWYKDLSEEKQGEFDILYKDNFSFGFILMEFSTYARMMTPNHPKLPISLKHANAGLPKEILQCSAYRDLLQLLLSHGKAVEEKFLALKNTIGN